MNEKTELMRSPRQETDRRTVAEKALGVPGRNFCSCQEESGSKRSTKGKETRVSIF